jgi:CRISPR-associated protein Cas1
MKTHLNTLFVTTQGTYLARRGESLQVRLDRKVLAQLPLHNFEAIVCFGRVACSPALLGACGERGVAVSLLSERGHFLASVRGFTSGNVLLRRTQYRTADDPTGSLAIARRMVQAKLANSRSVLLRAARDVDQAADLTRQQHLQQAATSLGALAPEVATATNIDQLRGLEGEAASRYFAAFDTLLSPAASADAFHFVRRSRRPPLDPVNALLSFLYTLLLHDARSACESAGLDPAVGFLHDDRPGKPSLALDLMEEFRAFVADRLALSLINRRQIAADGFTTRDNGAVEMNDKTRKTVLAAYQQRKGERLTHPVLDESTTVGMLVHLQALLLARTLRGDLDAYPAFLWKA